MYNRWNESPCSVEFSQVTRWYFLKNSKSIFVIIKFFLSSFKTKILSVATKCNGLKGKVLNSPLKSSISKPVNPLLRELSRLEIFSKIFFDRIYDRLTAIHSATIDKIVDRMNANIKIPFTLHTLIASIIACFRSFSLYRW